MEFLNKVGDNIVRIRKEKGISQIELSIRLGVEDSALRRIEKGRVNTSIYMLKQIADSLDVSISELTV